MIVDIYSLRIPYITPRGLQHTKEVKKRNQIKRFLTDDKEPWFKSAVENCMIPFKSSQSENKLKMFGIMHLNTRRVSRSPYLGVEIQVASHRLIFHARERMGCFGWEPSNIAVFTHYGNTTRPFMARWTYDCGYTTVFSPCLLFQMAVQSILNKERRICKEMMKALG